MIKGFKQHDQVHSFRPPKWDLNWSCMLWPEHPIYEPLATSPRKTWQCNITITSAITMKWDEKQHSCWHLPQPHKSQNYTLRTVVHLGLLMDFVAKKQMPDQSSWTFMVQARSSIFVLCASLETLHKPNQIFLSELEKTVHIFKGHLRKHHLWLDMWMTIIHASGDGLPLPLTTHKPTWAEGLSIHDVSPLLLPY